MSIIHLISANPLIWSHSTSAPLSMLTKRHKSIFGVTGTAINWIASYISHRSHTVKLCSSLFISTTMQVWCSTRICHLPLSFTIYISPISSILSQTGVFQHRYAADTQLYMAMSNHTASPDLSIQESALFILSTWLSLTIGLHLTLKIRCFNPCNLSMQ